MNRDLGAFVTARGLCRIIYPADTSPTNSVAASWLPEPCAAPSAPAALSTRPARRRGARLQGARSARSRRRATGAVTPAAGPREIVVLAGARGDGAGGKEAGVGASGAGGGDRGRWWWALEAAGQVPRVPRGAG